MKTHKPDLPRFLILPTNENIWKKIGNVKEFCDSVSEDILHQIKKDKNKTGWNLYTGLGGIAYMYWLKRKDKDCKKILKKCMENPDFKKSKQCTFLCGPVGIWALAAVVWKSEKYLEKVLQWETKAKETKSNELLFGKAGYVAALLFLRDNLEFEREKESNPKRGRYYNSDLTDDYNCMTQNEMSQLDIELRLGKKNYKKVINGIRRISKTILMEGEKTK